MRMRDAITEIESTYSELKALLLEKDCKIVSEEPPEHILVCHGSLRGVSPRSAKKIVDFQIRQHNSGSRMVTQSSVSSDWANLTLWGNVAAGIVAAIFWWIASDITMLLVNGKIGYWAFLAEAFGFPNIQYAFFMIDITRALSVVLVITIILEILDVFIVYKKINTFAEEILRPLLVS
jgi:hypothetical protein